MNQQFRYRQFPASNPLANVLIVVAGIVIISLSLALGIFVFLAVSAFVIVMALVMSVRSWWYRRRFGRRDEQGRRAESPGRPQHLVIEGEFQRVEKMRERDPGS